MKKCQICEKELTGRQTKFCSKGCKAKTTNEKFQNYRSQKKRGKDRRKELVDILGGECQLCGYKKNQAALCFHHRNPEDKSFTITIRKCSNCTWESLVEEANKCELLCANCHMEIHYPDYEIGPAGFEPATKRL